MLKVTSPESPSATGRVAFHEVFAPLLVSVAVRVVPASVTVGAGIASLEVKASVRVSPDFARFVDALFEASVTLLKVGAVVSKVILLLLVVYCWHFRWVLQLCLVY